MTKQEFVSKMEKAIEECKKGNKGQEFTCNILRRIDKKLEYDFKKTFGKKFKIMTNYDEPYQIPICFGYGYDNKKALKVRLAALECYLHQSLIYGHYKEL
jgi:hypothetical protein